MRSRRTTVRNAFQHDRAINMQRVDSQQARRVLDRIVGYHISPLLWKKLRVRAARSRESVAGRLIVEREGRSVHLRRRSIGPSMRRCGNLTRGRPS